MFILTSGHVLNQVGYRGEINNSNLDIADKDRVAHLSTDEYLGAHLSRKRRDEALHAKRRECEKLIADEPSPSDPDYRAYQEACILRPKLVKAILADAAHAEQNPVGSTTIGTIFLSSGVRSEIIPSHVFNPPMNQYPDNKDPKAEKPFTVDYAFFEALEGLEEHCRNEFSSELFASLHSHPVEMDVARGAKDIVGIAPAGLDASHDSAVFKLGYRTKETYCKIDAERSVVNRTPPTATWDPTIVPVSSRGVAGTHGDSGSPIVDCQRYYVGMFNSGNPRKDTKRHFLPVQVLQWDLKNKYGYDMELYRPELFTDPAKIDQPELSDITLDLPIGEVQVGPGAEVHEVRSTEVLVKTDGQSQPRLVSPTRLAVEWGPLIRDYLATADRAIKDNRKAALAIRSKAFETPSKPPFRR